MSVLVISQILERFVNTMTGNEKYSLPSSENLRQPIQIQLCPKQKKIFPSFYCISENYIKFSTC